MVDTIPSILYKYRSVNKRSLSMIKNNQVYFASPLTFNDPFDCRYHENSFENMPPELIKKFALEYLKINNDHIDIVGLYEAIHSNPQMQLVMNQQQENLRFLLENQGILSLSACNDSILMWSHYADEHRGYCIGYKNGLGFVQKIIKLVKYSKIRNNDWVSQWLLSQNENRAQSEQRILNETVFTKSDHWSYEEEWRILGDVGVVQYIATNVDCIIFGLNMSKADRELVTLMLPIKEIKLYECVKSKERFAVEIQRL